MPRQLIGPRVAIAAVVSTIALTPGGVRADERVGLVVDDPAASGAPGATDPMLATTPIDATLPPSEYDPSDQGIGAALGLAVGSRSTPGGLHVAGHYTYKMTATDWFDGAVAFTFGSGGAACFRDRDNDVLCDHGFLDGFGVDLSAGVRRYLSAQNQFRPFVRASVGVGIVRFGDDDITGLVVPVRVGGGLRVHVAPAVAIVALGELVVGAGRFRDAGFEPQIGAAITAGAELRLR